MKKIIRFLEIGLPLAIALFSLPEYWWIWWGA